MAEVKVFTTKKLVEPKHVTLKLTPREAIFLRTTLTSACFVAKELDNVWQALYDAKIPTVNYNTIDNIDLTYQRWVEQLNRTTPEFPEGTKL